MARLHLSLFIKSIFVAVLCCCPAVLLAQSTAELQARAYLDAKEYAKAASAYQALYEKYPDNAEVYNDYLVVLTALKDYKKAEILARDQFNRSNKSNPVYLADLGNIYKADNKAAKAKEQYEASLQYLTGDDVLTQQLANIYANSGNDEYAIKVYERSIVLTQSPALYAAPLARLYNRNGQTEKAISITISGNQNMPQMRGESDIETTLLEIIGNDPEKARQAQKAIIKLVNTYPDNFEYTYLLIWVFSIQDNWEQALLQVQAMEKRNTDKGRLLQDLADNAIQKKQYDIAAKAIQSIINYGNNNPRYMWAREALLQMKLQQIRNNAIPDKAAITALQQAYADFFTEFPDAAARPVVNDYALLEAQYAGNVTHAIDLLNNAILQPQSSKLFQANCKLQLGDYYIIADQIWDAALMYSQVDKSFREDALGEDARFRNAKLSYYRGDFEMAQGQLSVLKASTSELIANDALYLSVLITENIPADSNMVPLTRFAYADLLLFQNKDEAAASLLDSIARAYPDHPLNDDILLLQSRIAEKRGNYTLAIDKLKKILEKHSKDVLADDALWRLGNINRINLKNEAEARKYYEQLIIDYPGSSFLQQARSLLKVNGSSTDDIRP